MSQASEGGVPDKAPPATEPPPPEEPPPVLGSWMRVYALLLFELCVLVALMYALARWAA